MQVTIKPGRARGTIAAPPSKSIAHRMLICAGLCADDTSIIRGLEPSQDVLATIDCLLELGAHVDFDAEAGIAKVSGVSPSALDHPAVLPCRECGSTLRFFVPLCLLASQPCTLTGSTTLMSRPMSVYEDLCMRQHLLYHKADGITVCGPLQPGTFEIPGNISSQFISGLLFALPLLPGNSTITLTGSVESRSYINLTLQALALFGVQAGWTNSATLNIPGWQHYHALDATVEGDYSNAAFLDALTTLGGAVQVTGLNPQSIQGDRIYQEHLTALAAGTPTISLADCPDLGPVLMAVAAACHGATFTECGRLAIKESNRGEAMAQELAKFSIPATISPDGQDVVIEDSPLQAPAEPLQGHNDHRIVMSLALLCTKTGGTIMESEAINKSFPSFFDKLHELGIEVEKSEVD